MRASDDVIPRSRHIALVGDMAVGKTTVGRLLSSETGRLFLDSDDVIETRTGMTTAEIAAADGIARLHDKELEVFVEMAGNATPAILAPAASVIDRQLGCEILRSCTTVWLVASEEALGTRRSQGGHRRPISGTEAGVLRERRHPLIAEIAQARIDTTAIAPEETVQQVLEALEVLS